MKTKRGLITTGVVELTENVGCNHPIYRPTDPIADLAATIVRLTDDDRARLRAAVADGGVCTGCWERKPHPPFCPNCWSDRND